MSMMPYESKLTEGRPVQPKKPVGRPRGVPSTIINVRLPLPLVAALDRYLDRLESQKGVKTNRGSIIRQSVADFLKAQAAGQK